MKIYMVMGVSNKQLVTVGGFNQSLPLIWADGMIGAIPVFSNKKKALKYAGGKFEVTKCETEKK